MKTTVDIPDRELSDAMRFAHAQTKREAIVTAIAEFNRRHRMAALARHAGTSNRWIGPGALQRQRRRG